MIIKFSCGLEGQEPSFLFAGYITNFISNISPDKEFNLNLFNQITKKNNYIIVKCDIEKE